MGKKLKKTRNSPLPPPEKKIFFSLAPPLSKCRRGPCLLVPTYPNGAHPNGAQINKFCTETMFVRLKA